MADDIKVYMVCTSEEDSAEVGQMLKRVSASLSAVDTFIDKMVELDEDDPMLSAQVGPMLQRLTLSLMQLYPNSRQMASDIKAIGDFKVRII